MITNTKLDDSFPVSQFEIDGFSTPFRLDRKKMVVLFYYSFTVTL